jgi:hypothetical protein
MSIKCVPVLTHAEEMDGMLTNLQAKRAAVIDAKRELDCAEYETVKWLAEHGYHHLLKLNTSRLMVEVAYARRTRR